jgi:predicted Zn-dependent protease
MMRFFAHTRAEEASADQSGVRYMAAAGIDPAGAIELLDLFRGQEALSAGRRDPYMMTHPLTRDRLRTVEALSAAYSGPRTRKADAAYWFARAQGKLSAFQRAPKWTQRRAPASLTRDIRLMREAIAWHKQSDAARALQAIDGALSLRGADPFLHELKGQILLESRRFGPAVGAYRRAVDLAPGNALILGGYGRALLAAGQPRDALTQLERARSRDFRDTRVLRDLGTAYAQTGQNGMAAMVTAERYALQGRLKDAGVLAERASGLLPRGSAAWARAQDVLRAAQRAK